MANCGCNDYSRTQLLRRAAAEAGRGPPGDRAGMPLPAGTGLTRRSFVSRATGLALSVYGAAASARRPSSRGSPPPRRRRPRRPHPRLGLPLRRRGFAHAARAHGAHPQYASWRPNLALPAAQGTPLTEDPSLRWHPSLAGLAELHGEGKVSVMPAIGYADAEPVALHLAALLGGRRDEPVRPLGLARPLPRPSRRARQPAPGSRPRLGPRSRCWPPASVPVATVAEPDNYDFWTPGVWGTVQDKMLDAFGDLGEAATSDVGLAQARSAAAATGRLRDQLAPFQDGFTTPGGVTYPTGSFADRLRALAAMIDGGLPLRSWRSRPAGTTPIRTSSTACLVTCSRSATACAPSSATSRRARSRTVCWCTCGASSGAGPRRTVPAPTTGRPAPAS